MDNHSNRDETKLIGFEEVRAPKKAAVGRQARGKATPALIAFKTEPSPPAPEPMEPLGDSAPVAEWKRALMHRTRKSAAIISNSHSTLECAIAGFERSVRDLGIEGVKMQADLRDQMKRSLTYRLPNEAWHAIHGLDRRSQGAIMLGMVSSAHDGWARDRVGSLFGKGKGLEYLFLPVELTGKSSLRDVAAAIMRYLPSLGLDLGMSKPSEYDTLYAYDTLGDVLVSPSFQVMADAFTVARANLAELNRINSPEDLVRYIMAYGKYNRLLGRAASSRLCDREFAYKVAMQVSRNDPERIIARW